MRSAPEIPPRGARIAHEHCLISPAGVKENVRPMFTTRGGGRLGSGPPNIAHPCASGIFAMLPRNFHCASKADLWRIDRAETLPASQGRLFLTSSRAFRTAAGFSAAWRGRPLHRRRRRRSAPHRRARPFAHGVTAALRACRNASTGPSIAVVGRSVSMRRGRPDGGDSGIASGRWKPWSLGLGKPATAASR